ncbi:MAG TPA: flagellar motor stator protein MotA [Candidatus Sulfotelmatobacter sp.]|nr:flagellar motor stator protein MotA [Candidatus Sulfotelmatobacter sp.]
MLPIIGGAIIFVCALGAFALEEGKFSILIQPLEFIIIVGVAIGSYVIANRGNVLGRTVVYLSSIFRGRRYNKDSYLELLSLLYTAFKLAKTKGMLALEQHVENPQESNLFQRFPAFMNDQSSLVFLCDYLRLLTLGTDNPHEVEALMDEEIETNHQEALLVPNALQVVADALPAIGIVAAVLGVIVTMGVIDQPAPVIGTHIGAALTGTLMGVLFSYGFVGPIASLLRQDVEAEMKYLQCMKAGILAHMQGYAPAVSVEFARKALMTDVRPTFYEVEATVSSLPPV